jgi:hypothetical protein
MHVFVAHGASLGDGAHRARAGQARSGHATLYPVFIHCKQSEKLRKFERHKTYCPHSCEREFIPCRRPVKAASPVRADSSDALMVLRCQLHICY